MKISDLYSSEPGNGRSPLGSDYGIYVDRSDSLGHVTFTAIKRGTNEELGHSSIEKNVIVNLDSETKDKKKSSLIASMLLRDMCKYADQENIVLGIDLESLADSDKTFVHRFGFMTNSEGWMERKPGGSLPFSVLETTTD